MDIKDLVNIAKEQGWTVYQSKRRGHWKFFSPDPNVPVIFTSSTPSDWRSAKNLRSELRRNGLAC